MSGTSSPDRCWSRRSKDSNPHRGAITLVGAQALYLRVGEADLAVASYTTDGDLALGADEARRLLEDAQTDSVAKKQVEQAKIDGVDRLWQNLKGTLPSGTPLGQIGVPVLEAT